MRRQFTVFTTAEQAMTNTDEVDEFMRVYDPDTWYDSVTPYRYLVEWCQRNAPGLPQCEYVRTTDGVWGCAGGRGLLSRAC